jgi:fluoroacetyl-CoA thioesterase
MEIEVGTSANVRLVVGDADTAIALGSGDVPVLGTPRIVALMEQAAVSALAGTLDDGATSVGTRIAVDHLAASPVGAVVTATAEVVDLDRRAVSFRVVVHEGDRQVATGDHVRFIVDRERFVGT